MLLNGRKYENQSNQNRYRARVPDCWLGLSSPRQGDNPNSVYGRLVPETRLLFPYVTNVTGWDTDIAISNTSLDPFGTTPQAGTCTLYFYGASAPSSPITTASIAAGTTWATQASLTAPGFNGYMIADCNFFFAHGVGAVLKSVDGPSISFSVPVLVIPNLLRSPPESAGQ